MHLPDGNLDGNGFRAFDHQSLSHLQDSGEKVLSVDRQSSYTAQQLIAALTALMNTYEPSEIRTQSPINMSDIYFDHSDHLATGRYTEKAYAQYRNRENSRLKYYVGYPIRQWDENVFDEQLQEKRAAFFTYGHFDGGVCSTLEICNRTPTYHAYLGRQYSFDPTE
jgi:LmbE family N-acetylglucosaminyl deacetylase